MNEFNPDWDVSDEVLRDLMQENKKLKAQLSQQVVYTDELQQLIRAGFMQGGKYRDLFKSERKDVFNALNPSPELLAQHDAGVIRRAVLSNVKSIRIGSNHVYDVCFMKDLEAYADKLRKVEA